LQRGELALERAELPNSYRAKMAFFFLNSSPFEKGGRGFVFFHTFLFKGETCGCDLTPLCKEGREIFGSNGVEVFKELQIHAISFGIKF
jgi:hypothetical protein